MAVCRESAGGYKKNNRRNGKAELVCKNRDQNSDVGQMGVRRHDASAFK